MKGTAMGHDKNDELRSENLRDEERRESTHENIEFATAGEDALTDDIGSQDERRHDGDRAHHHDED